MDQEAKQRVLDELHSLRDWVESSAPEDPEWEATLQERVAALEAALDEHEEPAPSLLTRLREEILEWELEHPQLTALAQRIASSLEGIGL